MRSIGIPVSRAQGQRIRTNDGLLGGGSVDRIVFDLTCPLLNDSGALSRSALAESCEMACRQVPRYSSCSDGRFPESSSGGS